MIDRTKALIGGALVTGVIAFGALGSAAAQDSTPTPTPTPQEQAPQERGNPDGHPCPDEEGGSGSGERSGAATSSGGDAVEY